MSEYNSKSEWMGSPQRISEDGKRLILGVWAGPLQCITNLIHEMAHLVEINDARILEFGWGLTTPETYMPGRYSCMASTPVTWQPTKREVRVIAMQWQLQNELGICVTMRKALSAMIYIYMPDWLNIPTNYYESQKIEDRDESRFLLLEHYMTECMNGKYTFTFFKEEWNRKNELLKQIALSN